jgi:UDP-N-acetylglucosamine 1-carboxyvinyltransferase
MPASLLIEGGVALKGEIAVSAAKNAALPAMAAALLTPAPVTLANVPDLGDVRTMLALLQTLGAGVGRRGAATTLTVERVASELAAYELVSTMRASVLVLGPLVARHGSARVALPGGCAIGVRPIDQHLKGLACLGAEIAIENGYVMARANRLKGARIVTDVVTVTGTENLMMAATLAEGTTLIENAAREPEVSDLAALLNAMGAHVHGAGTDRIEIEGVRELHGTVHRIVADRIEAATLLVAAAITGGDVQVTDMVPEHVAAVLATLQACGVLVETGPSWVRVRAGERPRPVDIVTGPFPGFPTDMQAQLMALLGLADGRSRITETIFENRYMHAAELCRLGARISTDGAIAVIQGVDAYQGAPVMASDLRASAALVLAGLAAGGRTHVSRIYHLDRGYERLEGKLGALGARIERRT